MIDLNLPAASQGDFSVEATLQDRAILARFTGNADMRLARRSRASSSASTPNRSGSPPRRSSSTSTGSSS